MRYPSISLGLGLALVLGFSLATGGCISAQSLRSIYQGVADAQGKIVQGLDATDEACQSLAHTPDELGRCRAGRDLARQGLRDQLKALSTVK